MNSVEVPRNLGFSAIVGENGWYVISYEQDILAQTSYPSLAGMIESFYLSGCAHLYESN